MSAVFEIYTYLSLIPLEMYARFVENNCNIPARPGPSYATNPLSADYQTFTYNGKFLCLSILVSPTLFTRLYLKASALLQVKHTSSHWLYFIANDLTIFNPYANLYLNSMNPVYNNAAAQSRIMQMLISWLLHWKDKSFKKVSNLLPWCSNCLHQSIRWIPRHDIESVRLQHDIQSLLCDGNRGGYPIQ